MLPDGGAFFMVFTQHVKKGALCNFANASELALCW